MITRPLLAATLTSSDLATLPWPLLASDKIDGIRALRSDGLVLSRKFLPIPNVYVQTVLSMTHQPYTCWLDGELVTYTAGVLDPFHTIQSKIMSHLGEPDFRWLVFDDLTHLLAPYQHRLERLSERSLPKVVGLCPQTVLHSAADCERYETLALARGAEGVMLRSQYASYKSGRSTLREAGLLKLKQFVDSEAVIIGFVELQHNFNDASVDELGLTKRSHAQLGQSPGGKLGSLRVLHPTFGEFEIGSGFTDAQRISFWHTQNSLRGHVVTFKYQPHGCKDKPRCPVFKGIRHD